MNHIINSFENKYEKWNLKNMKKLQKKRKALRSKLDKEYYF